MQILLAFSVELLRTQTLGYGATMANREYKFGSCRLDLDLDGNSKHFYRDDKQHAVEPMHLKLLLYLVENPGRLVWKSELRDAVWAGETRDDGLLRVCINKIRDLLGDDAQIPRYVRTVGKDGYWFLAPVTCVERPAVSSEWAPRPPGAPYDRGWFVERGIEAAGAAKLRNSWSPLALQGPKQSGKRLIVSHLLAEAQSHDSHLQAIRLDFSKLPADCLQNLETLLHEIARRILGELHADAIPVLMKQAFSRPGTPLSNMTWLMHARVLTWVERIIISFERLEILRDSPFQHDFFGMLRSWVQSQNDPWPRLRIICTLATEISRLESTHTSAFFNIAVPLQIGDFSRDELRKLAEIHRASLSEEELQFLWALLGGQPFLTRMLLYSVKQGQLPSTLIDSDRGEFGPLAAFLQGKKMELGGLGLLDKVRAAAHHTADLSDDEFCRLYEEGIVVKRAGAVRLRCKLYEDFFKR